LYLWGKGGGVALENVPSGSHSFLGMGNVIVAVVALALGRAQPSRAEALAVKLTTRKKFGEDT